MAGSQMLFNQGPQDSLLFDGRNSFFSNVGYSRSSNFAMEYADVSPAAGTPKLGSEVRFELDRIGDLVGNVDLRISLKGTGKNLGAGVTGGEAQNVLVDAAGYAMIDYVQLKVNDNEIEKIDGEMLYILNQLHRDPQHRHRQIIKEDKDDPDGADDRLLTSYAASDGAATNYSHDFIIPLGLFFSKHPSQYFPICAVAGNNHVRIVIKFRRPSELTIFNATKISFDNNGAPQNTHLSASFQDATACEIVENKCSLRVSHVHLTGPEAESLISKEHVRLMKLHQRHTASTLIKSTSVTLGSEAKYVMDLNFLHPVQELILVVRNTKFLKTGATDGVSGPNYFAFEGKGLNSFRKTEDGSLETTTKYAGPNTGSPDTEPFLSVLGWNLKLNNQSRYPSVSSGSSSGVSMDRDYTMHRILPSHHTMSTEGGDYIDAPADFSEIYVIPFALNPEGVNPSGSINFSKVSKAQLELFYRIDRGTGTDDAEFQVDVFAQHYNWSQLRDGRMILSFG